MSIARSCLFIALVLCTGWCLAASEVADGDLEPRPLTSAEEEAARLAVAYLQAGPVAWLERLDPEGPLGSLGRDAAVAEIGVRAGPPEGARWQLRTPGPGQPDTRAVLTIDFPSGAEETLVMDLTRVTGGGWRIHRLRGLVEPWVEAPLELGAGRTPPAPAGSSTPPSPPTPAAVFLIAASLLALLALLARTGLPAPATPGGGRWRRGPLRRALRPVAAALLTLFGGTVLLLACGGEEPRVVETPTVKPDETPFSGFTRLGELWPLRRALASGHDPAAMEALLARVPEDGPARLAADLWRAELALQTSALVEAEAILDELPTPAPVPLGSLLRARLALIRNHPDAASGAYHEVLFSGPDHDGIRLEAATAMVILGLTDEAEVGFTLLAEMGSRSAHAWYNRARIAVLHSRPEDGEHFLRQGWRLQPLERRELLAGPLLASLVARASLFPLFEFDSPEEPRVDPGLTYRRPLELPAGSSARLTGRLLQVELPGRRRGTMPAADAGPRLVIHGGAVLAPDGAEVLAADGLRRIEEAAALRRLPGLAAQVRTVDALAHPRRREQLLHTSHALARRHRWRDLVDLTAPIDGAVLDPVPSDLVLLRAGALTRLDRNDEARDLLIRLAQNDLMNRRRDPASLYLLAELAAENEEFDLAIKLIRRAGALSPHRRNEMRLRQISMQRRLAAAHQVRETDRFRIVYPRLTGDKYARQLGQVLEAEHRRLSRWIPPLEGGPVEVQLYPLEEFLRAYSAGALVLGVYDGVVRVPFADLRSLAPELVSILSHELAHAMIGRATDEKAPKWFHEGLAEHIQMTQDWANPIPDLHERGHTIAFPVLEPILQGFAEPQLIELAYGQSAWAVHYIEAEHGVAAIHDVLAAYRHGATTDEALQQALGLTEVEFHRAALAWCLDEAPAVWPTEVRRYDHELDLPFERSRDESGRRVARRPLDLAARPTEELDLEPSMARWHRTYRQQVAAFKRQLGPLMGDLSRGRVAPHARSCNQLARELDRLLTSRGALDAPAPRAALHLRDAFAGFREMARSCAAGDALATRTAYQRAESELAEAAQEMAPYGLAP